MTRPRRTYVLETMTGPGTLEAVQRTLDELWADRDVPELARMHMDLAVSEIAANIIEHSGGGRSVRLHMEVSAAADAVTVIFTDDGHPAPVDLRPAEMPDEMSDRGRGLAIAHRVLDELSYRRDEQGNHWTLLLRLTE
ncbi:ATP-binding protein [Mycolicibacterium palauense]|uniref:ATP-binding protein n=1 Tax=Mycolicibacterium palauense TaxID=2034511 RepID=UPI000BFEFFF5|nr:ATP-binding protein [Mycolicibacterium palauense]